MKQIIRKPATAAGLALGATLLAAGLTACVDPDPTSSEALAHTATTASSSARSTTASPATPDYSRLLLEPGDVSSPADTFSTRSSPHSTDGSDGVAELLVNQDDTRAIDITILVLPDAATATTTLHTTVGSIGTVVTGDGSPQPSSVGTDGTVVSGTSPDGAKAVTVLLFTQGRAVVRMEFGSAPDDPTPGEFVADVGKKQQIAVRSGLSS